MSRYGQLTPVVIGASCDDRYEMVDGFKRLRAGRKLGYSGLQARVMSGSERVMKAAIIHLNTQVRTIADLETALVIQSLCRKNGLSQGDKNKTHNCTQTQRSTRLCMLVFHSFNHKKS